MDDAIMDEVYIQSLFPSNMISPAKNRTEHTELISNYQIINNKNVSLQQTLQNSGIIRA